MARRRTAADGAEVLDNEEQEKLIQDMKGQVERQSKESRTLMALLFGLLACGAAALGGQALLSEGFGLYTVLVPVLSWEATMATFTLCTVALAAAALVVVGGPRLRLPAGAVGGLACLVELALALPTLVEDWPPANAWLVPCLPPGCLLLAWYVDRDMSSMATEVDGLNELKYDYKSI
uniref:Uncharacterized protein n=1 Tax=Rhizochromulina marina TaxID=1034831 RepID=A0A7S2SFQ4_9STRA|mmetsp:Transcript_28680/g.83849  ORF Transcript_28680/g.83849 Transcript_28680/m.83849 type:complete len:178 (+) Transcript_28680:59-592(+)|eukprot:CAMPEP_0118974460 /NCGR_PEP_ID=MMETSP1173-20130426/11685_1 /TAXON_ID=1034831 /ORGANISM="Rhizochromulina marina cf, Strain CCMP1243" /LENGTH=177 /DNA_ID=CAMNT_0006924197 /DNA_START=40 /DNA_END=573 /DNA_ORIENTATION=+